MVTTCPLKPATQDTRLLKSVWETIDSSSCPYSYNFHLHTVASDGRLEPKEIVDQALAIGLKGLAITDHHSVVGSQQAMSYLATLNCNHDNLPHLWTGIEITAQLQEVKVHILGYGFAPNHWAISPYTQGEAPQGQAAQAAQVINSIHQAGGLAVLAHPERYRRSARQLIPAAARLNIDGVETYYAYNNSPIWQPSPKQTQIVQVLATEHHLYSTCGTDTHGQDILIKYP